MEYDEKTMLLRKLTPDQVQEEYQRGRLNDSDVDDYIAVKQIEKDFWTSDPDSIGHAHQRGYISDQQLDAWLDYRESPGRYYAKELHKGFNSGMWAAAQDFVDQWLKPIALVEAQNLKAEQAEEQFTKQLGKPSGQWTEADRAAYRKHLMENSWNDQDQKSFDKTSTLPKASIDGPPIGGLSKAVGSIAEFSTVFVPYMGVLDKAMKVGKLAEFSSKFPKWASFLKQSIASPLATATVVNPYEDRLSNLVAEHSELLSPVMDYLKADESDPRPLATVKAMVEDTLLGAGMEIAFLAAKGIVKSLGVLKANLWEKHGGNHVRIQEEVQELGENLTSTEAKRSTGGATKAQSAAEMQGVPEGQTVGQALPSDLPAPPAVQLSETLQQTTEEILQLARGGEGYDLSKGMTYHNIEKMVDQPEEALQLIEHLSKKYQSEIQEAQQGVKPIEQSISEANAILSETLGTDGAKLSSVVQRFADAGKNLEALTWAARQVFTAANNLLLKTAKEAVTEADKLKVQRLTLLTHDLHTAFLTGRAGVARSMNLMKYMGDSSLNFKALPEEILKDAWEQGGEAAARLTAELVRLADSGATTGDISRFTRKYYGLRPIDGLVELGQSAIISGVDTFRGNVFGTTARMLWDSLNVHLALGLESLRHWNIDPIRQTGMYWSALGQGLAESFVASPRKAWRGIAEAFSKSRTSGGTIGQSTRAAVNAAQDSKHLGGFWKALLTGEAQLDSVPQYSHTGAIPNFDKLPLGDIIRFPFRLLTASDEPMQAASYRAWQRLYAWEHLYNGPKSLRGTKLEQGIKSLLDDPPAWLHTAALNRSRELTFKANLEGTQKNIHNLLNDYSQSSVPAKVLGPLFKLAFVPFDKVLFNIGNTVVSGTPLALITKRYSQEVAAGGIRAWRARAQIATGSAMLLMGVSLAQEGRLRGRIPYQDKTTANAIGMQESSFYNSEKNQWESIKRLDPAATLFTIGADLVSLWDVYRSTQETPEEDFDKAVWSAIAILGEVVGNTTGMEGFHQFTQLLMGEHGNSSPAKFLYQQAGAKLVPFSSLARDVAQWNDPQLRELGKTWDSVMDYIWSQYADRSKLLPRRHPLYGTTESYEGSAWHGGKVRSFTDDPALLEAARIGLRLDKMDDLMSIKGQTVRMTPEQHDRAQQNVSDMRIGKHTGLQEVLNQLVSDQRYQSIKDDETKRGVMSRVISDVRKGARLLAVQQDPELRRAIEEKLLTRRDTALGVYAEPFHPALTGRLKAYLEADLNTLEKSHP